MMTKLTVKDDQGKQLLSLEYDASKVQEVRIGSPSGTIELAVSETEEAERQR
jgi:hypothetical protein